MSKRRKNAAEQRCFVVGEMGEEQGVRYLAGSAKEAARAWCELNRDKLLDAHNYDVTVWTDDAAEPWSDFQRWHVDLTQQPAFIIDRVKDDQDDHDQ